MPRRPRTLVDGGIYHVFNRGNNRHDLFCDQEGIGQVLTIEPGTFRNVPNSDLC